MKLFDAFLSGLLFGYCHLDASCIIPILDSSFICFILISGIFPQLYFPVLLLIFFHFCHIFKFQELFVPLCMSFCNSIHFLPFMHIMKCILHC